MVDGDAQNQIIIKDKSRSITQIKKVVNLPGLLTSLLVNWSEVVRVIYVLGT